MTTTTQHPSIELGDRAHDLEAAALWWLDGACPRREQRGIAAVSVVLEEVRRRRTVPDDLLGVEGLSSLAGALHRHAGWGYRLGQFIVNDIYRQMTVWDLDDEHHGDFAMVA